MPSKQRSIEEIQKDIDARKAKALVPPKDGESTQSYIRRVQFSIKNRQIALARDPANKKKIKNEIRMLRALEDILWKKFVVPQDLPASARKKFVAPQDLPASARLPKARFFQHTKNDL